MKTSMNHFHCQKLKLAAVIASTLAMGVPVGARAAQLEEVIVTATKSSQSLENVGMTITAMSGKDLARQGISNVADLAKSTPGLTYAPSPAATPVYTLRGVGFFESSLAAYPDVSLYLDEVPLPFPIMSSLTAFDLERVEVLKGPQGTLFGNNATGGAINFIAAKPSNSPEAGISLGYSRFDTRDVSGHVSGPLSDTLRARLAVKSVKSDNWQHSYTRKDENGALNNEAARLLVDWNATDRLTLSFNLNGWRDRDDPVAPQKIATDAQNPPGSVGLGGTVPASLPILNYPDAPNDAQRADWVHGLPFKDNKFWQGAVRAEYDLNDNLTLISITGFDKLNYQNATPGSGTALLGLELTNDHGDMKSITQELRIQADYDTVRWQAGLDYEKSDVYQETFLEYADSTSFAVNGITQSVYSSDQHMKNKAVFGNIEYDISDKVTLKAGARYTNAKRNSLAYNGDLGLPTSHGYTLTQFFNAVYGLIYGGAVPTIPTGGSIVLDPQTLTTVEPRGSLDEHNTSWMVGVDYHLDDNTMLYANIRKGYKAGSLPHLSGAITEAYAAVTQESLTDYEMGFKSKLLDDQLSVNGAVFYYDYKNKQLRAKFVDPIFGALDQLKNVPKSKLQGAEMDVAYSPIDGLRLSGAFTYLDTKIEDYTGAVGTTVVGGLIQPVNASFKGAHLPYAPRWQYVGRADYDFPISDQIDGFAGVGITGQSESIGILTINPEQRNLYTINERLLVDANIGVKASDGSWQVMLWGKNLTNKYYWTNTIQAYDTVVRYPGKPVEYGVTFGYNFF